MALSRTAKGRAELKAHGKKPAPAGVAADYQAADKGRSMKNLPRHVRKKK